MTPRRGRVRWAHAATLWALTAMAASPAQAAAAQLRVSEAVGSLAAGDSVRLRVRGSIRIQASLVAWRADTLVLSVTGLESLWPVPVDHLVALDTHRLRSPRDGFRHGLGMGIGAGVFLGAAVGLGLHLTGINRDEDGPPGEQMMHSVLKYTGLFTVGGAFVGGVLGGRNPGIGWVRVPLPGR